MLVAALLTALLPPVTGQVVRHFEYGANPFARGQHRGVDLAARPGAAVRAPCAGAIVAAGTVAGESVVSLSCGRDRVSLLGVAATVEPGEHVVPGERVGSVVPKGAHAASERVASVHLGVRRAGDPFAYRDPTPLLATEPPPSPPLPPAAPVRPKGPSGPQAPPHSPAWPQREPASPRERPAPVTPPAQAAHAAGPPATALAGLALLLGAATAGAGRRARRRRHDLRPSRAWNRASA